jgi:hypothetical protein
VAEQYKTAISVSDSDWSARSQLKTENNRALAHLLWYIGWNILLVRSWAGCSTHVSKSVVTTNRVHCANPLLPCLINPWFDPSQNPTAFIPRYTDVSHFQLHRYKHIHGNLFQHPTNLYGLCLGWILTLRFSGICLTFRKMLRLPRQHEQLLWPVIPLLTSL